MIQNSELAKIYPDYKIVWESRKQICVQWLDSNGDIALNEVTNAPVIGIYSKGKK